MQQPVAESAINMTPNDLSIATVVTGTLPEPFVNPYIEKCDKFIFRISND